MRVLLIGPAESLHVTRWASFLAERQHDVTVFSEQLPLASLGKVAVRIAPLAWLPRPVRLLVAAIALRVVQMVLKPDVVHIHSVGSNSLSTVLLRGGRLVVSPWGSDILRPSSSLHRVLAVRTLRRAALVLTTSRQMREAILAVVAPTAVDVQVISWGIDTSRFSPPSTGVRAAARLRWGLPTNATVLVSVRASTEVYRTLQIIDAFSVAASRRTDLHLVLLAGFTAVGRPATTRTTDYRQHAWSRARSLPDRITIVDRPLSDLEVASLLGCADAAISIPAWDQRSTSVLEALASGLHVLGTDIAPYRELRAEGSAMDLIGEPIEANLAEAMLRVDPSPDPARQDASEHLRAAESRSLQFAKIERAIRGVAEKHSRR